MIYLLLCLSTLTGTGKAIFGKYTGIAARNAKRTAVLNFQAFLVSFVVLLAVANAKLAGLATLSSFSWRLSVVFALCIAATQIFQVKALREGNTAIVQLLYACGFLIPVVYSAFRFRDPISLWQGIGVGLLLPALYLIVLKGPPAPTGAERRHRLRPWLFAVAATVGAGFVGDIQKTHQKSDHADEMLLFLVCSFFFCAVFSGIAALCTKTDGADAGSGRSPSVPLRRSIAAPLGLGLSVGFLNYLNLYLSGRLPAVVFFPVYNVGTLLLTFFLAGVLFRERTTAAQKAGFALGIVAILIIGMF